MISRMERITVVVPVYNESQNIDMVYDRTMTIAERYTGTYNMELMFIDNCSTDDTQKRIEKLAQKDDRVKAIFNARNFGFGRSSFYGLTRAEGDAVIMLYADLQDPPEVIPRFIEEWEKGAKIVVGIKNRSKENPIMYIIRKLYYWLIFKLSDVEQIKQFDGFGLYDKEFISILKELDDPIPYLRGIVGELGYKRAQVFFSQDKRIYGRSKWDFNKLYDYAMLGLTSYSKTLMRLATWIGFIVAIVCLIIGTITIIQKVFFWNEIPVGNAAIIVGLFFIGAVQLIFLGILGEYIMNINQRTTKRPLVIEERRINMEGKK